MKKLFVIFFLLTLLLCGQGWAVTHTVGAVGCDHTTLAQAEADTCNIINVKAGTYAEASNPLFTRAASWVAIDGDGTVTVTNGGAGTYSGSFAGNNSIISIRGFVFDAVAKTYSFVIANTANNKTLDHCTFTASGGGTPTDLIIGTGTNDEIHITNGLFTGSPTTAAIALATITNLDLEGNTFAHTSARGIWLTADNGGAAHGILIGGNAFNCSLSNRCISVVGGGAVTVSANTGTITSNVTDPNSFFEAVADGKSGALSILNNNITINAAMVGSFINIKTGTYMILIRGNTHTNTSTTNASTAVLVLNQVNPVIDDNTFVIGSTKNTAGLCVIKVYSSGTDCTAGGTVPGATITNNDITCAQTGGRLILVGQDTSDAGDHLLDGAIIRGNTCIATAAGPHCIEYGYNKNGLISKNYTSGGNYGIVIKGDDTWTAGYCAYNITLDSAAENIYLKGQKDVPVYNNTFYLSSGKTQTGGLLYLTTNADSAGTPATGAIIKNNIFYTQPLQNQINCDTDSSVGLATSNNQYWDGTGIRCIVGITTYTVWANWQSAGYDAHGISADPKWKTAGTDFRLTPPSPCRDAGYEWVGAPSTDYYGKPTPKGTARDIGAAEYQPTGGGYDKLRLRPQLY